MRNLFIKISPYSSKRLISFIMESNLENSPMIRLDSFLGMIALSKTYLRVKYTFSSL